MVFGRCQWEETARVVLAWDPAKAAWLVVAAGQGRWEGLEPRAGAIHWHRLGAGRGILRAGLHREGSAQQAKSAVLEAEVSEVISDGQKFKIKKVDCPSK